MKLIVHPGLHKTGSTYLQHVLNGNHAALAQAGVWYEPQPGYPAHHFAAWEILRGNPDPLQVMIGHARERNCHTLVLSSEDLEGALYDPRPRDAIAQAAASGGIADIEWHIVLREPGACFASLFHQLQHHVYADALALFHDVMRRGFIHIEQPVPGDGTPYWYYAFDHAHDLAQLAEESPSRVFAHDFTDRTPYPGWQVIAACGASDAIASLPGENARNARLDTQAVVQGYAARLEEIVPSAEDQAAILPGFGESLSASVAHLGTYARIIGERYAQSHAAALARFAPQPPAIQPAMAKNQP